VRRFFSAIAFAATLVVVLGAAGCGQRFDREAGNAPAAADLAADALTALELERSVHVEPENLGQRVEFDPATELKPLDELSSRLLSSFE
jgi:hypothetical protein